QELVIVVSHGSWRKFVLGEIEPGLPFRFAGAKQYGRRVIAIEDDRLALPVVFRKFYAGERGEGGHIVQPADDVRILRPGLDPGAPRKRWNAVAALAQRALGAAERRVAGIWIDVLPGAVVRCPEHVRILIESKRSDLVQYSADPCVVFDDRVGVFAFRERL